MALRPKTYGTRRSHAKPAGETVNGITAEEPKLKLRKIDIAPTGIRNGKEKDLGTAPIEDTLLHGLRKDDDMASDVRVGERAPPSYTTNVEEMPTIASPTSRSLRSRKLSAQDMLPEDTSTKGAFSRRKGIRRSIDRSATPKNQLIVSMTGFKSISTDHSPSSRPKPSFGPNGFTEDHQQSPVGLSIELKDMPSNLNNLAIWVAQLIRKGHQDKSPLLAISKPSRRDYSPQHGQDIEMSDALENVEHARMTRCKEKERLQQLKRKESANGLNDVFSDGAGKSLRSKDAVPVERLLKDQLNEELKEKLFGSSSTTDVSTDIIEHNACGKLLFNAIVDIGDSADRNSAAVLKSALEERKDDAPFLSALDSLGSSSKVMAFINFLFSKDNGPYWEASNADESRPSTGAETSGATTITETSGLTSRVGTSISDAEGLVTTSDTKKAMNNQIAEKQKQSQVVIQALEAATIVLVHIQQGEAGAGYITPYASGSMVSHPTGQHHLTRYDVAHGPQNPNNPTHGMTYGPPLGTNLNNYASHCTNPLAIHPNSYASPYSGPRNPPPANYASPYAKSMFPDQTGGTALVSSFENQANRHDGHETHHHIMEAHTSPQYITRTEAKKGNDQAASQDISNEGPWARQASREADKQGISNEKETISKAHDKDIRHSSSNEKQLASIVADLDKAEIDQVMKQGGDDDDGTSSDEDLTDDDLPAVHPKDKNVTPPAENHKLFTGERIGDFTSVENIDWLLTVGNGGKIPTPSTKKITSPPFISSSSQMDDKVQTEVNRIIDEIIFYKNWPSLPGATPKQLFYASAEGQRLAAELKRLMAIANPVINTIIPRAESEARLRFYQQLESRAIKEKRDYEIQTRYYRPPIQIQQWVPPPPPAAFSTFRFPIPPTLPSNGPMEVPFVPRGNVIAAPPGGRNIEEEKKAETYGYPPVPGSRPGDSKEGQKRKRAGRR